MSSGITAPFADAHDNQLPTLPQAEAPTNVPTKRIAAHVVIDMQDDFLNALDGSSNIGHHPIANQLIENINHFNARLDPLIFRSFVESETGDGWLDSLGQDSPYVSLQKAFVNKIPSHTKRTSSAFEMELYQSCGDFHHFLQNNNVADLYLSGINRSICVWKTALEAQKFGYRVHIIHDLTADPKQFTGNNDYPAITESMAKAHGIGWVTAEEAVFALNSQSPQVSLDAAPPSPR